MKKDMIGPCGINRYDSMMGTVVEANTYGVRLLLDDCDEEKMPIYAFAFCEAPVGSRLLVTIKYYNRNRNNFIVNLDSVGGETSSFKVNPKRAAA